MKSLLLLSFLIFSQALFAIPRANVTLTEKNTVVLRGEVTGESVANVFFQAKKLSAELAKNESLFLIIDSGGGSITAGLELIRNLKTLGRKVHTITTFGASMAFITAQSLGARLLTEDGVYMSHKASGVFEGEFPGQLDSRYGFFLRVVKKINQQIAARTGKIHTTESYENLTENEYWCSGKDCGKQGFVDYIVNARCDASLSGRHVVTENFVILGFSINVESVYDKCPLNSTALSQTVKVDGQTVVDPDISKIVPFSDIPGIKQILPFIKQIIDRKERSPIKLKL